MKKLLLLMTCIAMIFCMAVPSLAEDVKMTFTVEQVTADESNTIDVPIILSNNVGITGATLYIEYNNELKLNSITAGDALKALALSKSANLSELPIKLLWDGMDADSSNGTVAVLNFDKPAKEGTYEIVIYSKEHEVIDSNLEPVNVETINGCIQIEKKTDDNPPKTDDEGDDDEDDGKDIASGNGTGTLIWRIDSEGCLYITGEGEGSVNSWTAPEWIKYGTQIKKAVISSSGMKSMEYWFRDCSNLTQVDLRGCDTKEVKDMSDMFRNCYSLENINFGELDTSKLRYMASMFYDCKALKSLDLNSFNTSNVTHMGSLFNGCRTLKSLDLSNFNTSNVTHMNDMFNGCTSLENLNISKFDTSNVEYMDSMFEYCIALKNVNISSFQTSNVSDMNSMFNGCSLLESLDLSSFDLSRVVDYDKMLLGCTSLQIINSPHVIKEHQLIEFPLRTRWYTSINKNPFYLSTSDDTYYRDNSEMVYPVNLVVDGINEDGYEFTGSQIKPDIKIYDRGNLLKLNVDYTVKYANNTNVGEAKIIVTGKGNYSQVYNIPFSIYPKSLGDGVDASNGISISLADKTFNDGKEQISKPTVSYGKIKLKENVDYTTLYSNDRCNIGVVSVTIRGIGNYTDSAKGEYKIYDKNKNFSSIYVESEKSKVYTGEQIILDEKELQVYTTKFKTKKLEPNVDYKVTYYNNVNVGSATAIITGIGSYEEMGNSKKISFKIDPHPLTDIKVQLKESVEYNGTAIKPAFDVIVDGNVIDPSCYTVSYSNNTNAAFTNYSKSPTITIKGKGNYKGTVICKFNILQKKLTEEDVNISIPNVKYVPNKSESSYSIKPVIKYGKKTLANGKDYKVIFDNMFDGDAVQLVNIEFIGNYRGTCQAFFRFNGSGIVSNLSDGFKIVVDDVKYNGKEAKPKVSVIDETSNKAISASNYTVSYSFNDDITDWADVTIEAKGINYEGSCSENFRIYEDSISKASIRISDQYFTREQINPESSDISVYIDGSKNLIEGTDYEVEYGDSILVGNGKGTLTIKGIGKYGSAKTVKFNILPKKMQ